MTRAPFAALLLLLGACAASPARYGAPLVAGSGPELTVGELLAAPEAHDGRTVTVTGTIHEVCIKKGCWMTLADGPREVRVTFLDYGFFVPTDSAGAEVRARGRFALELVPVEEARHYLEDAGRHAEAAAIVAPVPSFTLVASGVELRR
ncbi:MAG TPA: DUF4920 domain-containing protein [Planctomycetota bacterium]